MGFLPELDENGLIVQKKKKVKIKAPRTSFIPIDTNRDKFIESPVFCRRCDDRMYRVNRSKPTKKQLKKTYYFLRWDRCRNCGTFYMDESSKVINKNRVRSSKQKKAPRPLKPQDYVSYINSKKWNKRRRLYFALNGNTCAICGSRERLNLHHKTYARLGCELDIDLVPLCGDHHDEFHEVQGKTTKDMVSATDQFIEYKKGNYIPNYP